MAWAEESWRRSSYRKVNERNDESCLAVVLRERESGGGWEWRTPNRFVSKIKQPASDSMPRPVSSLTSRSPLADIPVFTSAHFSFPSEWRPCPFPLSSHFTRCLLEVTVVLLAHLLSYMRGLQARSDERMADHQAPSSKVITASVYPHLCWPTTDNYNYDSHFHHRLVTVSKGNVVAFSKA